MPLKDLFSFGESCTNPAIAEACGLFKAEAYQVALGKFLVNFCVRGHTRLILFVIKAFFFLGVQGKDCVVFGAITTPAYRPGGSSCGVV